MPHCLKEQTPSVLPATNIQLCEKHQVTFLCVGGQHVEFFLDWRTQHSISYEQRVLLSETLDFSELGVWQ